MLSLASDSLSFFIEEGMHEDVNIITMNHVCLLNWKKERESEWNWLNWDYTSEKGEF